MARREFPMADPAPGGAGVIDDGGVGVAIESAQKGIEFSPARSHRRVRDELEPDPETRDETPVNVVCISERSPWTHERPLKHGEQTQVPKWVADLLAKKGHVTIVR